MLEFRILESPLNTRRGTPARHRAIFGWLQHRRCRGPLLICWINSNCLTRNTIRMPLILPKWQRIHSSQPSGWRGKEWNSFQLCSRLKHNREGIIEQLKLEGTSRILKLQKEGKKKKKLFIYTNSLPIQSLSHAANVFNEKMISSRLQLFFSPIHLVEIAKMELI